MTESVPTFLEALGQISGEAAAGPSLDVGPVTSLAGAKVWVDLAGDGSEASVACNRLRSTWPVVGQVVLVVILPGSAPVVLGHLGDGDDPAGLVRVTDLIATGYIDANTFRTTGNAIYGPVDRDAAIRWSPTGALELVNGNGTQSRGLVGEFATFFGPVSAYRFVAQQNAYYPTEGIDGALHWGSDGAAEFVNRAGNALRGLRVSRLHANDVDSNGDINALGGMRAEGGLSCGGTFDVATRANGANWSSRYFDGALAWGSDGATDVCNWAGNAFRGIRSTNFLTVASAARYKKNHRSIKEHTGKNALDVVRDLKIDAWEYDPEVADFDAEPERVRVGLMIDELPDQLINHYVDPQGRDLSSYDVGQMLNVALAAVQEQAQQIDTLTARVEALEKRGTPPPKKTEA